MDPVTLIAIAQFAYSTYQMMNSTGKDPNEALIGLLIAINGKLNIMNDKLDIVINEINHIPNKVIYHQQISEIVGVLGQTDTIFKDYNYKITLLGKVKGKASFIEEYEGNITSRLIKIQDAFNNLEKYYDPFTVSHIVLCARVDYELSILIDKDENYIKHQMEAYLEYFKSALWQRSNNLLQQTTDFKNEIELWRRGQTIFKPRTRSATGNFSYGFLTPEKFDNNMFTYEELQMIENLHHLGLLSLQDMNIKFKYDFIDDPIPECRHLSQQEQNQKWKEYWADLLKMGYLVSLTGETMIWKMRPPSSFNVVYAYQSKEVPVVLRNNFIKLISYSAAHQSAIESIKFLTQVLSSKRN